MKAPDWDEDSPGLAANIARVVSELHRQALAGEELTVDLVRGWHRGLMAGLVIDDPDWPPMPEDSWRGGFRGSTPETAFDVGVGNLPGVHHAEVADQVARFFAQLASLMAEVDQRIGPDGPVTGEAIDLVVNVSAWAHSEWVRIHPFVNGNGRTARLLVEFLTVRFRLPTYLTIRPRPAGDYGSAARAAMSGDWKPTAGYFKWLLEKRIARGA